MKGVHGRFSMVNRFALTDPPIEIIFSWTLLIWDDED